MKWVYPVNGHKTFEASTFVMGAALPGGQVRIQGQPFPCSAETGSFVVPVMLENGPNEVVIEALDASGNPVERQTRQVHRVPPYPIIAAEELAWHADTLQPRGEVWVRPGEWLNLSFAASEGVHATVEIPGVGSPKAVERYAGQPGVVDTREGVFAELHQTRRPIPKRGYYELSMQIPTSTPSLERVPITLRLQAGTQDKQVSLPLQLTVLLQPKPAIVIKDQAILRTDPVGGARLTPQPKGVRLWIDGLQQGWYRVRLSYTQSAWIAQEDVTLLPEASLAPNPLQLIRTRAIGPHTAEVLLSVPEHAPILCTARQDQLSVQLFQTVSYCDFIHYDPADTVVQEIVWSQTEETTVHTLLEVPGLSGYDLKPVNEGWRLTLKRLPARLEEIRVLIDPGHGGPETGSVGPSGVPEKSVNLAVSKLLAEQLQVRGFQMIAMTRTADEEVSLLTRSAQANAADIVLSIHHNALPDGRDPQQYRGASTYYYHAFSKPLAQALLSGLTEDGFLPNFGLLYDSLHLTRIPQALSVLVELGFFTHSEEYDRLLDPAVQQEAAARLAEALQNFCLRARY